MSLDCTDALTLAKRVRDWNGGGIMEHHALVYQMGGLPSVDPFGWRESRTNAAIETALRLGLIELYPSIGGTTYRAI